MSAREDLPVTPVYVKVRLRVGAGASARHLTVSREVLCLAESEAVADAVAADVTRQAATGLHRELLRALRGALEGQKGREG